MQGRKKYLLLKYYTSEQIEPKYWNSKDGRAREKGAYRESPEFNSRLQFIETQVLETLGKLQNDGNTITNDFIKTELDAIFRKEKDQTGKFLDLIQFIEKFIDVSDRKEGTKKSYIRVLRDLLEYQQEYNTNLLLFS